MAWLAAAPETSHRTLHGDEQSEIVGYGMEDGVKVLRDVACG
jgi:hypothetical protein